MDSQRFGDEQLNPRFRNSGSAILNVCTKYVKDGDTWNLELVLTDVYGMVLSSDSWIKLNKLSRILYGLPLDVHAGFHEFLLTAFNRQNKTAISTALEVFAFCNIVHCAP